MSTTKKRVFITGDFVMDHHIYQGQRHHFGDRRSRGVLEVQELGGAALVYHLLKELACCELQLAAAMDGNRQPECDPDKIPNEMKAHAFWRPFLKKEKDPESAVWRVAEAMGYGGVPPSNQAPRWPHLEANAESADIVVISDGGMGFRGDDLHSLTCSAEHRPWVVFKAAHPLVDDKLWSTLAEKVAMDKLVVVVSAQELRKGPANISTGLSWEDTLESIFRELKPDGALARLAQCRHLIVAFDSDGGLWVDQSQDAKPQTAHVVYEAASAEGQFRRTHKAKSFGMLSCLTAAVVWRLATDSDSPDFEKTLESGLSATRDLLENGHGRAAGPDGPEGFPAKRLARVVQEVTCRYSRAVFPASSMNAPPACGLAASPDRDGRCWSILQEALRELGQGCPDPAYQLAELISRRGTIALASLPHLQIGALTSADRYEIESLRVLRQMILDYRDGTPGCKPLSIGIFGPPGAGKSFAVKQITKALLNEKGWLEFNLSQFKDGTDDLIGAFHQIRDRALQGVLPVAFFDEFDSREYRWLQYLLAPMQDGAFQEGQITHPIGKCIFVFAGGTSYTFASFGPPIVDEEAYARFRLAKGPDFKSRLDGFLDVVGPNRRQIPRLNNDRKRYDLEDDRCDVFFPVRRALIIRSQLGLSPTDKLEIHQGLLCALLQVPCYTHGARSLGKLLEPLQAARPAPLTCSLTPPRSLLSLHIDATKFLELCHQPEAAPARPFPDDARRIVAKAIHAVWLNPARRDSQLTEEEERSFDALSEFLKNSNVAAADRMVETLQLIGLEVATGQADHDQEAHIRLKIEYHLELLAEAEHDGWMAWHLDQGWQFGPIKDADKKTHPCLKPYVLLPDIEKNKDRNSIRHYPDFVRKANMQITRAPRGAIRTTAAPQPPA